MNYANLHSSRPPDAYHTNYVLAGLSSAQHQYLYRPSSTTQAPLMAAFGWTDAEPAPETGNDGTMDRRERLPRLHPVYVIPWGAAEKMRSYFDAKPLNVGQTS